MWSFNPISGEDTTLRYCQQGELIKPESNIHSECTRNNPHENSCLDVDERKKNVHGVLIVPNGTSTFSELENQKKEMF